MNIRTFAVLRKPTSYLWKEWIRPLLLVGAVVLPFKSAIADWNWVPTGSMKPTILEGDVVLVNKIAYDLRVPFTFARVAKWAEPQPNDVVVFFSPADGTRMVKRIVAKAGDTVEMKGNVLTVNGQECTYEIPPDRLFADEFYEDKAAVVAVETLGKDEHYVAAFPGRMVPRAFGPTKVPEGHYFVLGDSRDNSFDSRFFGFVPKEKIVGRASRVLVSLDKNHFFVPRVNRFGATLQLE